MQRSARASTRQTGVPMTSAHPFVQRAQPPCATSTLALPPLGTRIDQASTLKRVSSPVATLNLEHRSWKH
jgi:hypothetical protein